jgi:hypothetical protein
VSPARWRNTGRGPRPPPLLPSGPRAGARSHTDTLFTVIIGYNPLTSSNVDRNAINLLQGLMELVPFGVDIFNALNERGIIRDAFNWVENELNRLDLSLNRIERTLDEAWEDIRLAEGVSYNLGVLRRHFGRLLADVESFAWSLVDHIIEMIKDDQGCGDWRGRRPARRESRLGPD